MPYISTIMFRTRTVRVLVSNYTATFAPFPLPPTLRLSVARVACRFTGVGLSRATSMTVSCLD